MQNYCFRLTIYLHKIPALFHKSTKRSDITEKVLYLMLYDRVGIEIHMMNSRSYSI